MAAPETQVFIAYSRKDEEFLRELRVFLKPLEQNKGVRIWYDGEIVAGEVWESSIKTALHQADIILLLASANSLASDYFYGQEVKEALERHRTQHCTVIPVILKPCGWEETELATLQALPKDGKPITTWANTDEAYKSVYDGLKAAVAQKQAKNKTSATPTQKKDTRNDQSSTLEATDKVPPPIAAHENTDAPAKKATARKPVAPKPAPPPKPEQNTATTVSSWPLWQWLSTALLIIVVVGWNYYKWRRQEKKDPEPVPITFQSLPGSSQVKADLLIVPGKGFGDIQIGVTTLAQIKAAYGNAFTKEENEYALILHYDTIGAAFAFQNSKVNRLVPDANRKLYFIELKPPFKAKTANGIVLGQSTMKQVAVALGNREWTTTLGSEYWLLHDKKRTIGFGAKKDMAHPTAGGSEAFYLSQTVQFIKISPEG